MSDQTPLDCDCHGPRIQGYWCCSCGVWRTDDNGLERCPVSHVRLQPRGGEGLSHLWAGWNHAAAMKIWERDADIRAGLTSDGRGRSRSPDLP